MSTTTSNLVAVKVPSVGESITSGVIGSWKKKNGDTVASGDPLFEIETDKVTSEVFAESSGTLEILVAEGTEVKVGQVVAHILPGKGAGKPSVAAPAKPARSEGGPTSSFKTEPSVNVNLNVNERSPSSISHPSSLAAADAAPRTFRLGKESRRRMSPLRRKIADRLVSAQHTAAILTTFNEADLSKLIALRA